MSTSATWTVQNPAVGQEYIAPSAYWVVPANGSSVSVTVQAFNSSGGLITVSSMTAIRRNISAGSDAGSFTYSGGNTVTSTGSTGTNGSNIFAPAGKINSGSAAQLRMYITYTGSVYDQPPNAPSNLAPSGTVTTLTPTFTGSFSDPTSGDFLAQYEIAVNNASNGGGSQLWVSGPINASSAEQAAAAFTRAYGGPALGFGSSYSFRAHMANQNGSWGPWSSWVNFQTVQGPNNPTINAPQGLQTSLTPAWSFTYSSPASTALAFYRLVVQAVPSYTWIYDSGWVADSAASGATITGSVPGAANLQYGGQYAINFMAQDANGAQSGWSQMGFNVAALPQVAPATPAGGVTVTTQTPTFVWTYSDPNYAQNQAQIEVQNATTSADLVLTSWLSQSATQWVSTTSIPFGTQVRWRVQVKNSAGLGSGWSAWATAYVNNAPSATIIAPTNGATVATLAPTVTWSYTASGGGQAQASAQITVSDTSGNPLATETQSGAATSFTLPADGVLQNGTTYHLQVSVTDTNSVTGASGVITFTVALTPPADLQGQPLPSGTNWLTSALLNTDSGNGSPPGWNQTTSGGVTAHFSVDPTFTQPIPLANGDGPVLGAAVVALSGATAAGQDAGISQSLTISVPGWTAGATVLSAVAQAQVAVTSGAPNVFVTLEFWNGATFLSALNSATPLGDTGGTLTRLLGPQGVTIPATTTVVKVTLQIVSSAAGDAATVWWCDAQLEAATSSAANMIEGSLGTGDSYDTNGFSVRTFTSGAPPVVTGLPGADTDPASAAGGLLQFVWDTSLADPRFTAYLVERRRQDASNDDTAWETLATLTNVQQSAYNDYTAASQTVYQYAVRQQIAYVGGGVGVSQHRAIATGSVDFSPAWYLTNAGQAGAPIWNLRLRYVQATRQLQWKERATYSAFLGRVGAARDAGAPAGYLHTLVCYFSELRGDSRLAIRRQLIAMQRLGGVWYLKDPAGLAVPVFISDISFGDAATYSETILTATIALLQATDTTDD